MKEDDDEGKEDGEGMKEEERGIKGQEEILYLLYCLLYLSNKIFLPETTDDKLSLGNFVGSIGFRVPVSF